MHPTIAILRTRWWSAIITSVVFWIVFYFIVPTMALIIINSRSLMPGTLFAGALVAPWFSAKVHNIPAAYIVPIYYAIVAYGWFTQPVEFDGNPKLALASYMTFWFLQAQLVAMIIAGFMLIRRARKLEF